MDSFSSTHISGHIDVSEAGELILSVAYEPGWRVLVDGKEVQPGLFDNTFISLYLTEGQHTVTMSYRPAGLAIGAAVSLASLAAFVLILCWDRRRRTRAVSPEGGAQ